MGLSYLSGKSWLEVSREERLFCAFLYGDIRNSEKNFVVWLKDTTDLRLDADADWEVGYEVCFYRDVLRHRAEQVRGSGYSEKRTFDLCLFSEDTIVIIEAKVQQPFNRSQVDDIRRDGVDIPRLVGESIRVLPVVLASSQYFDNLRTYGDPDMLRDLTQISWKQIHDLYGRELYDRAEHLYRK